jgi:lysophospholipase L1-like esterase
LRRRFQQAALFVGSLAFFLAIAELALRLWLPGGYYVWPPHFRETFSLDLDVLEGASDESNLTINAQGMRGDPLPKDGRYQLLAIGGSTTICIYLDDADAWPHLVQRRLEDEFGEGSVWVGNVGRTGHSTAHHLLQLEKLLGQYPEIDAVLMLVGINDMLSRVSLLRDPIPLPAIGSTQQLRSAFSIFPGSDADSPWYRRTRIEQLFAMRSWRLPGQRGQGPQVDSQGAFALRARDHRRQATEFLEELPGLPDGLAGYRRSLNDIVDAAQAAGVRLIFLTQPTLWREGLSPEEEASLWLGGPRFDRLGPGAAFYSVRALADGMARYNETLLGVCRERGVECIDVASQLPRDGVVFWDDAHFTVEGSRRLARLVADYLRAHPPLAGQPGVSRRSRQSSPRLAALSAAKTVKASW